MPSVPQESGLSSLAALSLPKTRIGGIPIENAHGIGGCWSISSTSWWGCGQFYDRTASVRVVGKYFPYGQERPSATTNGTEKFATYFRDSETGLDYAQNRYHQPGMGRFMTTDPSAASAKAGEPGSWNRYAYTRGDPVNRTDPLGQDDTGDPNQCAILDANPELAAQNGGGAAQCYQLEENSGGGGGAIGGGGFYDPNASVFANDLGSANSGNSLTFSGAYDLNNGAPGFGPDPGVPPPPPPDCQSQILNATNNQFGTNYTNANVNSTFKYSTGAPSGQGTLNLNIYGSTAGVSTGYYPVNWWTYVIGYGPTLHVLSGPGGHGGLDSQQTLWFGPNQGTFHIDSGYVYNPFGAFSHWLLNMTMAGGYPQC